MTIINFITIIFIFTIDKNWRKEFTKKRVAKVGTYNKKISLIGSQQTVPHLSRSSEVKGGDELHLDG